MRIISLVQRLNLLLVPFSPRATALLLLGLMGVSGQAGLIGFYTFDDPAHPFKDASGLNNDLQGGFADPTYITNGGFQGGAFQFNGTQRLVSPVDITPTLQPALTMGAWVKTTSLIAGLHKILGCDDGGYDRVIGLDDRNGPFRFTAFVGSDATSGPPPLGLPGPANTNDWTFVAVTYDEVNFQALIYLSLNAASSGPLLVVTNGTGFDSDCATNTSIGSLRPDNDAEGWIGAIDNVFFYDQVLSVDQLTAIRDGGKNAILGGAGDDPGLKVIALPDLQHFSKSPSLHTNILTIRNTGASKPLLITKVTISGADASYYSALSFPSSIAPGQSGNIQFNFDSKGQVGQFLAALALESNEPNNPSLTLDLSAQVSAPALMGFYPFDDASNPLKDASGGGNTLQNGFDSGVSDPTYHAGGGYSGGAFEFNGSQRLAAPININPDVVPSVVMGAWVKTYTLDPGLHKVMGIDNGGWGRVIGLDTRTQPAGGPLPDPTFRYIAFTGANNNGPTQAAPDGTVPTPTSTNDWTFLAAVYDQPNNQVTLYVDLDLSNTNHPPLAIPAAAIEPLGTTSVGIGAIHPTGNDETWIGLIDNVFMIKGTLTADGIRAIRDGGAQAVLQYKADPLLILPTTTAFGDLPNGSPKTAQLQVKNGGTAKSLDLVSFQVTGPDASYYMVNTSPESLAPGATLNIQVTLDPKGREGSFRATLQIISTDSVNRQASIDLAAWVPYSSPAHALVGFYPFDDAANPLKDKSGNGHDLQLVQTAQPIYLSQGGFSGGAYEFDGAQRLIAPFDPGPDAMPRMTMGAWVKTYSLDPGLRKVMGHDAGGWGRVIGLDDRTQAAGGPLAAGTLRYIAFTGANNHGPTQTDPSGTVPAPPDTNTWTFLAVTYDTSVDKVTLYVGLDAALTNHPLLEISDDYLPIAGQSTLSIGSLRPDNLDECWVGLIDNVFIYQTALTSNQVVQLFSGGAGAILPPASATVTISRDAGGKLILSWTGTLESANDLTGTWTAVQNATSPMTITPTGSRQFYRAK